MTDSTGSGWLRAAVGVVFAGGLALSGYAAYLHVSIASRVRAGSCDGCSPWHPLFVVAPMALGATLVLGAGFVLSRR
jgi:hypothetical protein